MKRLMILFVILTLILPFGLVSAQNPPLGSREDNDCNPGGAMEGKCTTEWHWVCGWYTARWKEKGGWLTRNNPFFNSACISLLPPQPAPELAIDSSFIGCVLIFNVVPPLYSNFGSNPILPIFSPNYTNPSCSGVPNNFFASVFVYAASPAEAIALCQSNPPFANASPTTGDPNVYECF